MLVYNFESLIQEIKLNYSWTNTKNPLPKCAEPSLPESSPPKVSTIPTPNSPSSFLIKSNTPVHPSSNPLLQLAPKNSKTLSPKNSTSTPALKNQPKLISPSCIPTPARLSRKITSSRMLTNRNLLKTSLLNNCKPVETFNGMPTIKKFITCTKPLTQSNPKFRDACQPIPWSPHSHQELRKLIKSSKVENNSTTSSEWPLTTCSSPISPTSRKESPCAIKKPDQKRKYSKSRGLNFLLPTKISTKSTQTNTGLISNLKMKRCRFCWALPRYVETRRLRNSTKVKMEKRRIWLNGQKDSNSKAQFLTRQHHQ